MVSPTVIGHEDSSALSALEQELRDMNGALLIASVRQHELADQAHQAEGAIRDSEERYRTLFNLGPVAIYSCDAQGVIQNYNVRAAELWGRQPELGDCDEKFCASFKLFRPDGSFMPHERCPMADVLGGRVAEISNAEVLIERPDGSRIAVLVNIRPLRNPGGTVTGAINCFVDISERKVAAASLRESETRYRRLFESAQDGILALDAHSGQITDANPYLIAMLGYPRAELLGKELWQLVPRESADDLRVMIHQLQRTGYIRYDKLPLETAAGQPVDAELIAIVYQESDRAVIQCNIRDVTARRRLEQKTQEQAKSLADLHRRKDEFLAMLSHELRNPLAPILNAVQLLRLQKDRTEIQKDAHGMIERQVGQLARLVDDLLEVSRISTGRIHLQEERVDLRGIVLRAIETTEPQTGQKAQTVAKALPTDPIWVLGDPVRLEQVVVNLLNNASKYTDAGGHIWVGLKPEADEAVLRVRDNGMGISPEMLPRIFDLFAQADKSLDRSQGGLGIGLALVQSLATMHRGRVEARSTPGQGSEFIVRLPLILSEPIAKSVAAADTPAAGHALKVLVVDDNVDAAKGMSRLLQCFGHDTRSAHDGASAMQVAREYVPAVVLLDIGLPVIDGYEVAKWIRREPTLKDVVLVALTGYGQESDRQLSREAGFDHHLVKPVDFAKVEAILTSAAENVPADRN